MDDPEARRCFTFTQSSSLGGFLSGERVVGFEKCANIGEIFIHLFSTNDYLPYDCCWASILRGKDTFGIFHMECHRVTTESCKN